MNQLLHVLASKILSERVILAALLFGSRARGQVTDSSDIDLQVLSRNPKVIINNEWLACKNEFHVLLSSTRAASGGATKVTVLYSCGLVDIVLPRVLEMIAARLLVQARIYRHSAFISNRLRSLAVVIRPGFKMLKGTLSWQRFYERIAREIVPSRIDNVQVLEIARRSYLDAYWAYRKALDGELLAAQRWLHRVPFEANVNLLNELRSRRGLHPCYDARKSEISLTLEEQALIRLETTLDSRSICQASVFITENMRQLVKMLTGEEPGWPRFDAISGFKGFHSRPRESKL